MFDIEHLVEPVSLAEPCGPDLANDATFLELERLATGIPERRMGAALVRAVAPDWAAVAARSTTLLRRSKDWRTVLLLTRAALQLEGWPGLERGLALLLEVERRFGADVHPRDDQITSLFESDSQWNIWGEAMRVDLLGHEIGMPPDHRSLRGLLVIHRGDGTSAEQPALARALSAELERCPDLIQRLEACLVLLRDLRRALERRMGLLDSLSRVELLLKDFKSLITLELAPTEPVNVVEGKGPHESTETVSLRWYPRSPPAPPVQLPDIDTLAAPVADGDACGPNLEYDSDFLLLEAAEQGRAETTFDPEVAPDWLQVHRLAIDLLLRTKDIRIAISLTRAMTRMDGLRGTARGIGLLARLLDTFWQCVHPQEESDEPDGLLFRKNTLAKLVAPDGLLGDLRDVEVGDDEVTTLGEIDHVLHLPQSQWSQTPPTILNALTAQFRRVSHWHDDLQAVCAAVGSMCGSIAIHDDWSELLSPLVEFLADLQAAAQSALDRNQPSSAVGHGTGAMSQQAITLAAWAKSITWRPRYEQPNLFDKLAAPIAGGEPCGPNLEYEWDFLQLGQMVEDHWRRQFAPAVPPAWRDVRRRAMNLLLRTKDLRVAIILARAATRTEGIYGAGQGLRLVARLLDAHWTDVHPQISAVDGDPAYRLKSLEPLSSLDGLLGDLHAVNIGHKHAPVRLGFVDGVHDPSRANSGAGLPNALETRSAFAAQLGFEPRWLEDLQTARSAVDAISRTIASRLGPPDSLAPLAGFFARLHWAAHAAADTNDSGGRAELDDPQAPVHGAAFEPGEHFLQTFQALGAEGQDEARQLLRQLVETLATSTVPVGGPEGNDA